MWPLSILDIDPMNYAIWPIIESRVSVKSYLNVALLASWSALDEEVIRCSYHSVTNRLELIVRVK